MVNVWRLMAFNERNYLQAVVQWAIHNNRIAIGWSEVGSLNQYGTPGDIQHQVIAIFQVLPAANPTAGIQLWNFRGGAHQFHAQAQGGPHTHRLAMQCGDLVILKAREWRQSVVMRVQGPYEYVPRVSVELPPYGYRHQRKAIPTDCSPQALWNEAGRAAPHQSVRGNALVLCQFPVECQGGRGCSLSG